MDNWAWMKMCFQWRMGTNFFCYCIVPRWYQFIWVRSLLAVDMPAVSLICYDEFVASLSVEADIFYFSLACPSWYFSYLHIIYNSDFLILQRWNCRFRKSTYHGPHGVLQLQGLGLPFQSGGGWANLGVNCRYHGPVFKVSSQPFPTNHVK